MFAVSRQPSRRFKSSRKGTATVEFAVCLPVLVILSLGAIEATNAIFLKERVTAAAYEGARKASTPNKTSANAIAAAQSVLTQFGVSGGTITVTPAVGTATTAGTQVTVNVSVSLSSNSWMKAFIIGKVVSNVSAKAVMDHQ
jgi:Flp pilus assembly protein TadG